jgi:hypothetical protein
MHDFLGCQKVVFSDEEMGQAAARDFAGAISNRNTIKIAVVAVLPEVVEMIRAYMSAKESPYPLRFFMSETDARHWIG